MKKRLLLTDRERALFFALHKYITKWHEANPDIGMGPSIDMVTEQCEQESGIKLFHRDRDSINARILNELRTKRRTGV